MSKAVMSEPVIAHLADTKGPPIIVMDKVNKWYGSLHVLRDVSMTVAEKERVVVCGPSGSGKSTMIRCINRLEVHQEGQIVVDGTELTDDLRSLDTIRREVGMVFQSFNLFPHLTILENCTLAPIWVRKTAQGGSRGNRDEFPHAGEDPRAGEESIPASFPAASSSALPSPAPSACVRRSCCSTNPPRRSIPR